MKFLKKIWNWFLSLFSSENRPQDSFFKGSMFFVKKQSGTGVDSSLGYGSIDTPESEEHIRYSFDAIVKNGGDALVYIAEKLINNPELQTKITSDGDNTLVKEAREKGVNRWIVSLKNDNQKFSFGKMETLIQQIAICYKWANKDEMCFLSCLESSERNVLSVSQVKQMKVWCNKYAPDKRFIVGAQSLNYLKSFVGTDIELWYEIRTKPFQLSQAIVDQYIADLQSLIPYGDVWAGEFWDGSSEFSKQITRRAREIGCVGIGSYVK